MKRSDAAGAMPPIDLQPTLHGELLTLRPVREEDFDAVHSAASDPLIWAQHPQRDRWRREVFAEYFRGAIESRSAFVVIERSSGRIIGCTRYHGHDPITREIEIGWTFLTRAHWGGRFNGEMKRLMLDHAFTFVDTVILLVGPTNIRSQTAVQRLGAVRAGTRRDDTGLESVLFMLDAKAWRSRAEPRPLIRPEREPDHDAISAVIEQAFRGAAHASGTEALIVSALRRNAALAASLVAEIGDRIVGHVALSPVRIDDGASGHLVPEGWFGLGPLAVRPEQQRNGVGAALVRGALELLVSRRARGCVVLGDPAYYGRFGFHSSPDLVFPGVSGPYLQWLAFDGSTPRGTVTYHAAFAVAPCVER